MRDIRDIIQRAVDLLGSQARLGEAIGCSQQRVSQMLRSGCVSAELAFAIDRATRGQVARHQLRPDIFPPPAAS